MSDFGRQSFTDKAGSAMKVRRSDGLHLTAFTYQSHSQPDSQKGMFEQAGDMLKGQSDSMASNMQPQV